MIRTYAVCRNMDGSIIDVFDDSEPLKDWEIIQSGLALHDAKIMAVDMLQKMINSLTHQQNTIAELEEND